MTYEESLELCERRIVYRVRDRNALRMQLQDALKHAPEDVPQLRAQITAADRDIANLNAELAALQRRGRINYGLGARAHG